MAITATATHTISLPSLRVSSPGMVVLQGAAALAASTGIARFVFTPILPLMQTQAGLSVSDGAGLATSNYVGYLLGALLGISAPGLVRSRWVMRFAMLLTVATLALMPAASDTSWWTAFRFVAGLTSALVFIYATSAMISHLREVGPHFVGWGFGGIGTGIALSGLVVVVVRATSTWQAAWFIAAGLTAALTVVAWRLRPATVEQRPSASLDQALPPTGNRFAALVVSYGFEGVGYIIAGTFLVAAVGQNGPAWLGDGAWVVVGLAAIPGAALWTALGRRWSRPTLLTVALGVQAVGVALAGVLPGSVSALVSAALFGGTFVGISSLALALGAYLQVPRAVALLTTGYGIGQILGPVLSRPLLTAGYNGPLLLSGVVIAAAALAGLVVRFRFPHRVGATIEPSRSSR
ncbi:MFS transporter [Curtobacterium sp. MCPF17_047]|uniref:YbfB/YjiJ family MFS transporter n=1 Tax=unclassified Curtobacterium TaxID=257496 RepID=UPI000DA9067A|nr:MULTISPECIES: YbfB/YjiJ family MFS transporter [unclassified Curtobacterium]PZE63029.1 MFS transporter [Curtobacterium sp. MCPF17_001]PZF68960.1 MFS transporter [Curtobacterium sp. MCPF17_047]WIB11329.1 YbfB/YjiJ family MFS transporter [Curtobacterium sp. MCPF17_052]